MVEPVLPAGATLAAFVMTVISWYATLRTGVQLIHNDIKDSKSYKRDVGVMIDDLGRQRDKIEEWKRQWLVWKEAPETLHMEFWGEKEYNRIRRNLRNMEAYCVEVGKELRPFAELTESNWRAMQRVKRKFLKFEFISMKRKYLQNLLDKMVKALKELDDAAKDGWQRSSRFKKSDIDFENVHHTGIGHLLVSLALRTDVYTETLWQSCRYAQEALTTELDLDIFDASSVETRNKQSEVIAKAAAENHVTLTILTRAATLQMAEMTRLCFKETTMPTDSSGTALADAINRIISSGSEQCYFIARSGGSGLTFRVFKSRAPYYGPGTGSRTSLRDIQSRNGPPLFTNSFLLGRISKFRIAFELAQACLLFLRTRWFSDICSCRIRCGTPSDSCDELPYDFTLQLGKSEHQHPLWAGIRENCWGQTQNHWNALTKPLRRLALLLIEVTLGTTVLAVECNESGAIAFVTFVEAKPHDLRRISYEIDEVLKSVRRAAYRSDAYMGAVKYCATTCFPEALGEGQIKEHLAKFYWSVVVPIKKFYEDLLDRHLERRRGIYITSGQPA